MSEESYVLTATIGAAERCGFDPGSNEVGGERIDGKAMDVLVALTEAAPDVVSIAALLDRVWPNVEVVDNVVYRAIARLRKALGDDARAPRFIENAARRGYRLVARVEGQAPTSLPTFDTSTSDARPRVCPPAPLLAVLTFDTVGGDRETADFSEGISEEILQMVSLSTHVQVIGRAASFHLRGADKAVCKVAADLKATHVLDGSVRRYGSKVRISTQLIECANQVCLWSHRFERSLGDVFALQDEIAATVVAAVTGVVAPRLAADVH